MANEFEVDEVRSRTMSRIRSRDTEVEIKLRRAFWARGIRYRKDYREASRCPDVAVVGKEVAGYRDCGP